MSKRKTAWLLVALVVAVSAVGFFVNTHLAKDLSFTQQEIQDRINSRLPLSKDDITVTALVVNFKAGVIGIDAGARGKKFGQMFAVSAYTIGALEYDPFEGKFYFKPQGVQIDNIVVAGASVSQAVAGFIEHFPKSEKVIKNKEKISEQVESWVYINVAKFVAWSLERTPVYTLPNTLKGNVIRMLLKSVEVREGVLIAHLSIWQFTWMVLTYFVLFVLAVAAAIGLLLHPEWGRSGRCNLGSLS